MIDVYYELEPNAKLFGKSYKYLAQFNFHPENSSAGERRLHHEALLNSNRAWIENANGVTIIKNRRAIYHHLEPVNYRELTWIKLQAVNIENL